MKTINSICDGVSIWSLGRWGYIEISMIHHIQCNAIIKSHNSLPVRVRYGVSFVTSKFGLYSPSLTAVLFNSLGPSDSTWRQRSGSTLAQVMAWCLMAPSHYLNRCWLIISKVEWDSTKSKFTRDNSAINHWNYLYIPWICYERSFSESYLFIWSQLVFN